MCKGHSLQSSQHLNLLKLVCLMDFFEQEANTAPLLSRITTPIPILLDSLKIAPSKLIFTKPACGLLHLEPPLLLFVTCTSVICKLVLNYASICFACSTTWWSRTTCWFTWALFLWFYTIQAVYANKSSDFPSAISHDSSSLTSVNSILDLKHHSWRSPQTTSNSGHDQSVGNYPEFPTYEK